MKNIIILHLISFSVLAQAADLFVVAPNDLDFPAEGNTVGWPLTFPELGITSRRYQQVYNSSQFSLIASQGGYIKQIWFREDMAPGGGAGDFLDSVQINLSITARSPDSLSPIFSENIGTIDTLVYGPSPLQISTAIGWTIIPLAQPFIYIPSKGNLLMDIRTTDATPYPLARRTLDAEDTVGDSISAIMANDVNATSGFVSTSGLVTGFTIEPIPEPSTWALLGLGFFGIWRFLSRRNNSTTNKDQGIHYGK
jgi:PEP-CTERM motif-containing protein